MKYLDSEKFILESVLSTITVVKIQDNLWKKIESGSYAGEINDEKAVELVERLTKKGFQLIIPKANY